MMERKKSKRIKSSRGALVGIEGSRSTSPLLRCTGPFLVDQVTSFFGFRGPTHCCRASKWGPQTVLHPCNQAQKRNPASGGLVTRERSKPSFSEIWALETSRKRRGDGRRAVAPKSCFLCWWVCPETRRIGHKPVESRRRRGRRNGRLKRAAEIVGHLAPFRKVQIRQMVLRSLFQAMRDELKHERRVGGQESRKGRLGVAGPSPER